MSKEPGALQTGMAPGPAPAFMTAGAVTSIPAAIAVFALVGRRVFLWYLALAAAGSLFAGLVFQAYTGKRPGAHAHLTLLERPACWRRRVQRDGRGPAAGSRAA